MSLLWVRQPCMDNEFSSRKKYYTQYTQKSIILRQTALVQVQPEAPSCVGGVRARRRNRMRDMRILMPWALGRAMLHLKDLRKLLGQRRPQRGENKNWNSCPEKKTSDKVFPVPLHYWMEKVSVLWIHWTNPFRYRPEHATTCDNIWTVSAVFCLFTALWSNIGSGCRK